MIKPPLVKQVNKKLQIQDLDLQLLLIEKLREIKTLRTIKIKLSSLQQSNESSVILDQQPINNDGFQTVHNIATRLTQQEDQLQSIFANKIQDKTENSPSKLSQQTSNEKKINYQPEVNENSQKTVIDLARSKNIIEQMLSNLEKECNDSQEDEIEEQLRLLEERARLRQQQNSNTSSRDFTFPQMNRSQINEKSSSIIVPERNLSLIQQDEQSLPFKQLTFQQKSYQNQGVYERTQTDHLNQIYPIEDIDEESGQDTNRSQLKNQVKVQDENTVMKLHGYQVYPLLQNTELNKTEKSLVAPLFIIEPDDKKENISIQPWKEENNFYDQQASSRQKQKKQGSGYKQLLDQHFKSRRASSNKSERSKNRNSNIPLSIQQKPIIQNMDQENDLNFQEKNFDFNEIEFNEKNEINKQNQIIPKPSLSSVQSLPNFMKDTQNFKNRKQTSSVKGEIDQKIPSILITSRGLPISSQSSRAFKNSLLAHNSIKLMGDTTILKDDSKDEAFSRSFNKEKTKSRSPMLKSDNKITRSKNKTISLLQTDLDNGRESQQKLRNNSVSPDQVRKIKTDANSGVKSSAQQNNTTIGPFYSHLEARMQAKHERKKSMPPNTNFQNQGLNLMSAQQSAIKPDLKVDDKENYSSMKQTCSSRAKSTVGNNKTGQQLVSASQSQRNVTSLNHMMPPTVRKPAPAPMPIYMDPKQKVKPSQATQKLQIQRIEKDVEIAIKKANPQDIDQLNFFEFRQSLFNLGYLPRLHSLERRQADLTIQAKKTVVYKELKSERDLLEQFWIYLNPLNIEFVEKSAAFDVLTLLMPAISSSLENEMVYQLSNLLANYYLQQFEIDVKAIHQANVLQQQAFDQPQLVNSQTLVTVGADQVSYQFEGGSLDFDHKINDHEENVAALNTYLTMKQKAWPILKFIQEFRSAHSRRFGSLAAQEQGIERAQELSEARLSTVPQIKRNKSVQKLIPKDGRKYKDESIQNLVENYTFSPRMDKKSRALADKFQKKVLFQAGQMLNSSLNGKEEGNAEVVLVKNVMDASSNLINNDQSFIASQVNDINKSQQVNNRSQSPAVVSQVPIYELQKFLGVKLQQKLEAQRTEQEQKEYQACTFAPKINRSKSSVRQGPRYLNFHTARTINIQDHDQAIQQAMQSATENPRAKANSKWVEYNLPNKQSSAASKEQKELEECTFRPKINTFQTKKNKKLEELQVKEITTTSSAFESNYDSQKQKPRGYEKVVNRLRQHNENQEKLRKDEEMRRTGNLLSKDTIAKMKPPSFLNNPDREKKNQRKNQILLSIEVSISAHKSGRIAIKEGDNLKTLASNFCKAYSLTKDVEDSLVEQLTEHLMNYNRLKELNQPKSDKKQNESSDESSTPRYSAKRKVSDITNSNFKDATKLIEKTKTEDQETPKLGALNYFSVQNESIIDKKENKKQASNFVSLGSNQLRNMQNSSTNNNNMQSSSTINNIQKQSSFIKSPATSNNNEIADEITGNRDWQKRMSDTSYPSTSDKILERFKEANRQYNAHTMQGQQAQRIGQAQRDEDLSDEDEYATANEAQNDRKI